MMTACILLTQALPTWCNAKWDSTGRTPTASKITMPPNLATRPPGQFLYPHVNRLSLSFSGNIAQQICQLFFLPCLCVECHRPSHSFYPVAVFLQPQSSTGLGRPTATGSNETAGPMQATRGPGQFGDLPRAWQEPGRISSDLVFFLEAQQAPAFKPKLRSKKGTSIGRPLGTRPGLGQRGWRRRAVDPIVILDPNMANWVRVDGGPGERTRSKQAERAFKYGRITSYPCRRPLFFPSSLPIPNCLSSLFPQRKGLASWVIHTFVYFVTTY